MKASIVWLVRLGVDQSLFPLKAAWSVRLKLGEDVDLVDFAQELVDAHHVPADRIEELERLAGLAMGKGEAGPPENDPFASATGTTAPMAKPAGASKSGSISLHPAADADSSTGVASENPAGLAPAGGPEAFPFARVGAMNDATLAANLRGLLRACAVKEAGSLHLSAGSPPFLLRRRVARPLGDYALSAEDARRLNLALLTPHQRDSFLERKDLSCAFSLGDDLCCRASLLFHREGPAGVYRVASSKPPRLDELAPEAADAIRRMLAHEAGLMLVTGLPGSGKSSLLAALTAELGESLRGRIFAIEDPIEFTHAASGGRIMQREVGAHTRSFSAALRGTLREDPDVIVLGGLPDRETVELALGAAETGRLIVAVAPGGDIAAALRGVLEVFPPAWHESRRGALAACLRGVVCQRLSPSAAGGMEPVREILSLTPEAAALVRAGDFDALRAVAETIG